MDNIFEVLKQHKGNKKSIITPDEKFTYPQLFNEVMILSKTLPKEEHSNIGIYLPNGVMFLKALFAIQAIHKIPVLLTVLETIDQVCESIDFTDQYMVITDTAHYASLKEKLVKSDSKKYIYNIDNDESELLNAHGVFKLPKDTLNPDEVAAILKTSGTTDNPKYVILTHKGLIFNIQAHINSLFLTKDDVTLIQLPMCFGYCFSSQTLAHIFLGATISFASTSFTPDVFLNDIERHNVTNSTVVPSMLSILDRYMSKQSKIYQIESLRYLCFGGAKTNISLIKEFSNRLSHAKLVQTYGLTEHSPRITTRIYEKNDQYTEDVGFALAGIEIQIRNGSGKQLTDEKAGEIWVKSPSVMLRYYANPTATMRIIKNKWLDTGDIGYFDKDKRLYITGRKKNIIIRSGININPEAIENCIMQASCVNRVQVIGEEHSVYGENPVANVLLDPLANHKDAREEILKLCKEQLPTHMLPYKIQFVDSLSMTITGKVKR